MILWASAGTLVLFGIGACASSVKPEARLESARGGGPARGPAPATSTAEGGTLHTVPLSELSVTSGVVQAADPSSLALRSGTVRAIVPGAGRAVAEAAFVYLGPSHDLAPLGSGEVRRQIGLKLRARDTCNVVYVMWHIEPTSGIHVSVKANPGETEHSQCGDRGYLFVTPSSWRRDLAGIRVGQRRILRAQIDGRQLTVTVDGEPAWVGALPAQAFAFDGPVGIRSDNGDFDVELRTSSAATSPP